MKKIYIALGNRPKWQIILLCLCFIAILGVIDNRTGDFSLTIFYILPVFIATWFVHKWVGLAFCIVSWAAITVAYIFPDFQSFKFSSMFIWNTSMEVFFLIF